MLHRWTARWRHMSCRRTARGPKRGRQPHQAVQGATPQVVQRGCPLAPGVMQARGDGTERGAPVSLSTAALLGASTLQLSQPGGHLSEKGGSHVAQTGCPLAPGVMQASCEGLDRGTPVSLNALALLCASTLSSLSRVATSSGDTHSL